MGVGNKLRPGVNNDSMKDIVGDGVGRSSLGKSRGGKTPGIGKGAEMVLFESVKFKERFKNESGSRKEAKGVGEFRGERLKKSRVKTNERVITHQRVRHFSAAYRTIQMGEDRRADRQGKSWTGQW